MTTIDRLKKQAVELGACELVKSMHDTESMVNLFFTEQGREFCLGKQFPTVKDFRILKAKGISNFSVFCDVSDVRIDNVVRVAAIGKTRLDAKYSGCDKVHYVVLMHGATAEIELSNYAVVKIEKTPDCEVHIINLDNTAKVL